MICLRCKQENTPDARYCNGCGAPLNSQKRKILFPGIKTIGVDLWKFWSSSKLTLNLAVLAIAGLILSLAQPQWFAPSTFFGGTWSTLFFWMIFSLNLLALALKAGYDALHFALKRGIGALLWRWGTSVNLAILLLGMLVAFGLVSTVLPQLSFNRTVDLIARYGPEEYALLAKLGLTHIFASWPFFILVGLFTVNLTACTYKRLRASVQYYRIAMRPKPPKAFANMMHHAQLDIPAGQTVDTWERIKTVLRSKHYRLREENGQLLAQKWRWERFAIDVFHVSLLVIVGALVVTNTLGYDILQANSEGDIFQVPRRDFQVRVDQFWSENYPGTERVMDWKTQLTVIENGQEVKTATLEVNHPLTYKGISFYQAAMGEDWQNGAQVTLKVIRTDDGRDLGEYTAKVSEGFDLPDEDIRVKASAFLPNFALTANQVAYSKSQSLLNPAVFLEVFDGSGQRLFRTWSFSRLPELQSLSDNGYRFFITGMRAPEFTGLELSFDPGVPVAYVGFFMAIITLVTNFLFKHRQIWIHLDSQEGQLHLGAKVRKGEMDEEFETILESINSPTKEIVQYAQ